MSNFKQFQIKENQENTPPDIGGFMGDRGKLKGDNLELEGGGFNSAKVVVGQGADSGGINSAGQGSDIVFWAGSTHQNRANAPFKVDADGNLTATSVENINLLLGSQTTDYEIANNANDQVVFSLTVTANELGSNGGIRVTVTGRAPISTSESTTSIKIKFGGSTIYTSPDLTDNPQKQFKIEVEIFNRNATGSQIAFGETVIYDVNNPSTVAAIVYGQPGITTTLDSTTNLTLQVTASESGETVGANAVINYVVVEKLR